jgi:hypothetical protein
MNKILSPRWLLVIILALALQASNLLKPLASSWSFNFDVGSTFGDRDKFDFKVSESGCVLMQIKSWSRSGSSGSAASQLALILNGSDRTSNYARVDGSTTGIVPLWVSYAITSTQVSRVKTWTISVVNFTKSGTAKGTVYLEYPPTQMPCELKVASSRTKGQINLSWSYTGKSFKGYFLIERSTDGKQWSVVNGCKKSSPTSSTTTPIKYSCSETGLKSSTTYYYRACANTSGVKCETTNPTTPAMSQKAP